MSNFNLWETASNFNKIGDNGAMLLATGLVIRLGEIPALAALAGAVGSVQNRGLPVPTPPLYNIVYGAMMEIIEGKAEGMPRRRKMAEGYIIRGDTPQSLGEWIAEQRKKS